MKAVRSSSSARPRIPHDLEALGYLGWAYAEVDSCGPAGVAFQKADRWSEDQGSTRRRRTGFATIATPTGPSKFNDGIAKINAAQEAYPDFGKAPENDADKTLHDEAKKNYDAAITSLTRASLLKPGNAQTMRNLGSVYAFMGDYRTAEGVFREGLKSAPDDSALAASLKSVRTGYAAQLLDEKKYDEAVSFYNELLKSDPNSSDLYLGLADAYFKRAADAHGDAAKPDYKLAGAAYAKAASLKPADADLPFNAALAFQNAGEWRFAETQWRASLKLRPNDVDAHVGARADAVRAEEVRRGGEGAAGRCDGESEEQGTPPPARCRVYEVQNNLKSTEELMVYLALQNGKPVADAAKAAQGAPAGSVAAKTLASMGTPEEVIPWEVDQQKYRELVLLEQESGIPLPERRAVRQIGLEHDRRGCIRQEVAGAVARAGGAHE